MVIIQLLQQEFHEKNVGLISKAVLIVERKSKPHSHIHTYIWFLHDYKKDTKYKYCSKKDHYDKEC